MGVVPYERRSIDLAGPRLRFHLIGIGGAGMSAIARVLAALGHDVRGSDRADSTTMRNLSEAGIDARVGHDAANVDGVDLVGVSTAIAPDNPEIEAADRLGIPIVHRYDLLAAIGATRRTLSVSGTHGKTTTSALLAHALEGAGMDPSFVIGGVVAGFGAGSRWTDGEWLVLEADESDSTFLAPPRAGAIVTNVERDHLDHHGSYEGLVEAFESFVAGTDGPVVVCADDDGARALGGTATYGERPGSDWSIEDVSRSAGGSSWAVTHHGERTALTVALPGRHLVLNATAAFALAVSVGADPGDAAGGIAAYRGVGRRFERRGTAGGVDFVDDYAHAPAEVAAVLDAVSALGPERVVAVFQPHRYSRTGELWAEYASVFDGADVVVVTDVYAAGESPVDGVTGHLVVDAIRDARPDADVRWMPARADLVSGLAALLQPGDLCLTMGAGDLTTLPDELIARLGESS